MDDYLVEKWLWKMEYCKRNRLPPAQKYVWDTAEKAYNKEHNKPVETTGAK